MWLGYSTCKHLSARPAKRAAAAGSIDSTRSPLTAAPRVVAPLIDAQLMVTNITASQVVRRMTRHSFDVWVWAVQHRKGKSVRAQNGGHWSNDGVRIFNMAQAMNPHWPELEYQAWQDTRATLPLWTQIVGKIPLMATPWLNYSWH